MVRWGRTGPNHKVELEEKSSYLISEDQMALLLIAIKEKEYMMLSYFIPTSVIRPPITPDSNIQYIMELYSPRFKGRGNYLLGIPSTTHPFQIPHHLALSSCKPGSSKP